ncbi:MAG TPA: DUF4407 domain-containing protein [Trebonia sp.]|nr:DUF4407 domain-containing protein [Trebonia sp.]
MPKLNQLRRLVLALSGADEEILEYVPSERTRFESLGWAILITSCMAMISMWFALSSALGINGIVAIPVAVFWGLVIMGIDRWLITSMPIDGARKFAMAVPRVLLAILLGTLISTPLVLRIFQSEIDAQMAVMQQKNYSSFLSNQQSSQVNQQVTTYYNELQQLDTVINSHGAQTGNTAADPELVAYNKQLTQLQSQLTHWTSLKATYYKNYICQLYGGADCPKKGDGPAAKASYTSYQQASQQVTSTQSQISGVQGEIQQRDQVLNSTSASSQQQRYAEALNQRPLVQAEYNTAVQRKNELQATFYAQNQASHGILMRLEALSQLSSGNLTVAAARLLLFLLFLVIECLPVTVKLLQRPGQYEAALREAKKAEQRDYQKFFSTRSRLRQAGLSPAGQARGTQAQARAPQGPPPAAEPQPDPIWNRTRRMATVLETPDDETPTEVFEDPGAARPGRGGYGPPEETARRDSHWRGADAWRNHWSHQDQDDLDGDGRRYTRQDPPMAATRVDYGFADELRDDRYHQDDRYRQDDSAGAYHEPSVPALEAASDDDGGSVLPRAEGNGGGIPLSWDDE